MFTSSAEYYDLIYGSFKDYRSEAAQIVRLLRSINPRCRSVLDVACGTGEHARLLAAEGFAVDGIDLNPAFVQIARRKHASGRILVEDMCDFRLPDRYDAVTCLFSSIAYLRTLDRVTAALNRFREHLGPHGVIVIEPWFPPGVLDPTHVSENVGEADGIRVRRTSRLRLGERESQLLFDYEITDGNGTRVQTEVHELGLFTIEEMLGAFRQAGLSADYDPTGLTGRGLYVATITSDS
jgi:SAM-dependent methyltransferase